MPLRKILPGLFLLGLLLIGSSQTYAETAASGDALPVARNSSTSPPIPYRREAQSLPEQSMTALLTTVLLLGCLAGALYYMRKRIQKFPGRTVLHPSKLSIVEKAHINSRLSVYVVRYRNKEVMFVHSGNTLSNLAEFPVIESPATASEECT